MEKEIERLDFGNNSEYSETEAAIHLNRYLTARPYVKGKRVLDVASGEGYGSYLLYKWGAASVDAIDIDEETVDRAKNMFGSEHVVFQCHTAEDLPFKDYTFDVITSFETIEHLDHPELFLQEIKRVLKPDGTILLSCPDDPYYYKKDGIENPFHKKRYTYFDFKELSEKYLGAHVQYYLGFAVAGFMSIPFSNSNYPEDKTPARTMNELFNYREITNAVYIPQRRYANHWDCNYYVGIWTSEEKGNGITAAINPREMFLSYEDKDIQFYQNAKKLSEKYNETCRKYKQQEKELRQMEETAKTSGIENKRLRMMLDLSKEENSALQCAVSSRVSSDEGELMKQLQYYRSEVFRLENSTCWKMTKPIRAILDFLKKILHRGE